MIVPRKRTEDDTCLQAALRYVELGWLALPACIPCPGGLCDHDWHRTHPCSPGKTPRVKWKTRQHVSAGEVQTWWLRWPHTNVAVVTGTRSNLLVLDIDPAHGGCESLAALEQHYGPLPLTVTQRTGSGGEHRLFIYPADVGRIGNTVGSTLGAGLDTRGEGGLIIVPPSRHPCGGVYRWTQDLEAGAVAVASAPDWLVTLLHHRNPTRRSTHVRGTAAYTSGAHVREGQRNRHLFAIACAMRDRGQTFDPILAELLAANAARCIPPLEDKEVTTIARSVLRYRPTFGAEPLPPPQRLEGLPLAGVPLPHREAIPARRVPLDGIPLAGEKPLCGAFTDVGREAVV